MTRKRDNWAHVLTLAVCQTKKGKGTTVRIGLTTHSLLDRLNVTITIIERHSIKKNKKHFVLFLHCVKCWAFIFNNTEKGVLYCKQLWEHCSYKFQSWSSISLWQNHLHSMTQSVCFRFKDNSSISITQPILSVFQIWIWLLCYINHKENHLLLLRKDIPPFWFICDYIWTFIGTIYMLPLHKI